MRNLFLLALLCLLSPFGCKKPSENSAAKSPLTGPEWFSDITASSGLNFKHVAGTNYFMPDQVGSGIAVFDYDNDGRLDVYLVQNGGTNSPARNQLFHQEPDGKFRDVSSG